jgi:cAMP-specific phosphodiesterase 4
MIYLKKGNMKQVLRLDDIDQCALLISTIIHDYKHPGLTNGFLVTTSHPIAVKYNGK